MTVAHSHVPPAEEAKPAPNCPRQNGFFPHPNPSVCDVFYNCIDGEPTESRCPPGLHFDEFQGVCVWPDSAGRQGCMDANSSEFRARVKSGQYRREEKEI